MDESFEPGTTILGRYVIERKLGQGGMGAVYVARHAELSRKRFALKVLRPEVFGIDEVEQRFRKEAEVLSALNHPGVVTVTDYGMHAGVPVMVMELLEGETLRALLERKTRLSTTETLRLVREVGATLDYTHGYDPPVIHRDLKPENLLILRSDGRAMVLDFGIAKVRGMGGAITMAHATLGTPQYMSPEQFRDASRVEAGTDVFALASVTYECLTGQPAFTGESLLAIEDAVATGARPRPSRAVPGIPAAVDDVLDRAWQFDPSLRHPSAGAFSAALARALEMATAAEVDAREPEPVNPRGATLLPPVRPGATMNLAVVAPPREPPAPPQPAPGDDRVTRSVRPRVSRPDAGRPSGASQTAAPALRANEPEKLAELTAAASRATVTPRRNRWAVGATALALAGLAALAVFYVARGTRVGTATTASSVDAGAHAPSVASTVEPPARLGSESDDASAGRAAAPRETDPFRVIAALLAPRVRACGNARPPERRTEVRVTWDPDGLPQQVQVERGIAPEVRACIGEQVARYGRVPPPADGRRTTRPLAFVLR